MAMKPNKFDVYHLSDINRREEFKDGERVFRGYGYDGSGNNGNIIYLMSVPLRRLLSFKAFVSTLKFNLTKENEIVNNNVSNDILFIEYAGNLDIDLTIDIPATTVNEAVNNVAKIEELQRLILPTAGEDGVSRVGNTTLPIFKVLFKNLISSGKSFKSTLFPNNVQYEFMLRNGFNCIIDKVDFEPDLEAGFFEFVGSKWAKNIKLNLKLLYESNSFSKIEWAEVIGKPIMGFSTGGLYSDIDNGCFPFGLAVNTGNKKLEDGWKISKESLDFTTNQINDFKEPNGQVTLSTRDIQNGNYLFLSMATKENKGEQAVVSSTNFSTRRRFVVFKSFLENFNRNVEVNYSEIKDRDRAIGIKVNSATPMTHKALGYKVKINIPAFSLTEAKKNCAKIQYLMRMFYKTFDDQKYELAVANLINSGQITDVIESSHRKIMAYFPGLIEKAGASKSPAPYNNFNKMFDNSIPVFLSNLSVDINLETGFFTENDGSLYPKEISIDMEFHANGKDLISSYNYNRLQDTYKMIKIESIKGSEHLFPLNRKTVKIGK